MRNEEVNEKRNIAHTGRIRKAKWIGLILRRNCLLKHDTEGNYTGKNVSDGKTKKDT